MNVRGICYWKREIILNRNWEELYVIYDIRKIPLLSHSHSRIQRSLMCDERWGARGTKGKKDILLPFMEQPEKTKLLFVRVYCQRRWEETTLSNSKKKNRGLKGRTDQRREDRRIKFVYLLFYLASQWILMETGPGSYTEEKETHIHIFQLRILWLLS